MSEDVQIVYRGSRAEGLWIKEILEEEKIGVIFKDTLSSSVQAGWADGYPEDAVRIFVETYNFEKAKKVIEDYFKNRKSSGKSKKDNKS
jgi:hypothetical protein